MNLRVTQNLHNNAHRHLLRNHERSARVAQIVKFVTGETCITCPDCLLVDVTGIVDGDTIDTNIGRVRFYGIDTPERGEACFSEATADTERLAGSEVRLEVKGGVKHGATSRLSGVTHAIFVLTATIALGSLVGHIPMAVLAAILIMVAWRIISVPELIKMARTAPRQDHLVLFSTLIITVTVDLIYAITAGVFVSLILLLRQLISLESASELQPDETGDIRQVSAKLGKLMQGRKDIIFFNAQGLISFHSLFEFERRLLEDDIRPLILRMKDMRYMDTTGMMTLETIIKGRRKIGARVMLSAIQPAVHLSLKKFGVLDLLGEGNVFSGTALAIESVPTGDIASIVPNETSLSELRIRVK